MYDLGKSHHVAVGVIDAMAETRAVSEFMARAPWAWGCRYDDVVRTDWEWTDKRIVHVNRTAALDASHRSMVDHRLSGPRASTYHRETVVAQLCNLVRKRVKHNVTGQERFVWVVRGAKNDHHRHALGYAEVASSRVGVSLPLHRRAAYAPVRSWQAS